GHVFHVRGKDANAGGGDAIARGVFDQVHGLVGEVEQLGFVARVGGVGRHSHARGDADFQAQILHPHVVADALVQASGDDHGVFLGGLRQQHHKFVAAVPEGEIDKAAVGFHHVADVGEQARSGEVAVRVVDVLEVVQVDEN